MPAAIPANEIIKALGWTITLRGSGDSEMNSQLSALFSQYFETGYAKRTIINVSKIATPIRDEIAPHLISTSSKRSNLSHPHYS
jgi:hypothetical protein